MAACLFRAVNPASLREANSFKLICSLWLTKATPSYCSTRGPLLYMPLTLGRTGCVRKNHSTIWQKVSRVKHVVQIHSVHLCMRGFIETEGPFTADFTLIQKQGVAYSCILFCGTAENPQMGASISLDAVVETCIVKCHTYLAISQFKAIISIPATGWAGDLQE